MHSISILFLVSTRGWGIFDGERSDSREESVDRTRVRMSREASTFEGVPTFGFRWSLEDEGNSVRDSGVPTYVSRYRREAPNTRVRIVCAYTRIYVGEASPSLLVGRGSRSFEGVGARSRVQLIPDSVEAQLFYPCPWSLYRARFRQPVRSEPQRSWSWASPLQWRLATVCVKIFITDPILYFRGVRAESSLCPQRGAGLGRN